MRRRLQACALSLLLLAEPAAALRLAVIGSATVMATPDAAQARSFRSSGGYSRSRSYSSRTPSFGSSSSYSQRTPSTSGGYSRPSSGGSSWFGGSSSSSQSTGDRAFSRQRSGAALQGYRTQQEEASQPPSTSTTGTSSTGGGSGWFGGGGNGGSGYGGGYGSRSGWFGNRGWSAPGYAYGGPRRFGIWDGLFLWFMLDHLTRPGYGQFFYNHQNDPGYQQWRAEADQRAQDNPELRQKLDALDQKVVQDQGQPRDPNYLPPDVPQDVATADDRRTPTTALASQGGSTGWLLVAFLAGAITLSYAALSHRRKTRAQGSGTMSTLGSAGAMLRHKLSGELYRPEHFRVGMTLTADPTPFILASGSTKVPVPDAGGGNLLVSVQAVGRVEDGNASLVRLYLPDKRSLFQLHLDAAGKPDECRFFGLIDEVSPADPNEWGAWLDPAQGMIGWPDFQTKDGKIYGRAWAPGTSRIAPRAIEETIETVQGTQTVKSQAMLYAAPTDAAPPAPETEYILVAAVEAAGQAWVEIRAGIDVNPAALSLA